MKNTSSPRFVSAARAAAAAFAVCAVAVSAAAQEGGGGAPPEGQPAPETWPPQIEGVTWDTGPTDGALGSFSKVTIPAGWNFSNAAGTKVLMERMENPVSGTEQGVVFPGSPEWFAVFTFSSIGYVKDEDRDELDADELLDSLKESNQAGNEERRKRGWSTLDLVGWQTPPHYDAATQNLEWGVLFNSSSGQVVNYDVRLLGRHGVMQVSLVAGPEAMAAALPQFRQMLAGHAFNEGERYAEYRAGDKIAEYGLAALVTGGALAVAAKTGFLKKFWKLLVAGVLAAAAGLKKLFGPKGTVKPSAGGGSGGASAG